LSESAHDAVLDSGFVNFGPDQIDGLPESAAHFRLRSSGQRVMMVGVAGEQGLQTAVRDVLRAHAVAGVATVEYCLAESPEAAREAADRDIRVLKPLYNEGLGRYRTTDPILPTKGRYTRRAMRNP
jgi:hypothetical protein